MIPRADLVAGLRDLGVSFEETAPNEVLIESFTRATSQRAEHLAREIEAAEQRGIERGKAQVLAVRAMA